ncbi:MAG: ribosome biogenesis GTPase Der [Firmicutes bacterium]|nr:ribosome biogenesis GTPase Der [Bacillota bacterium]
MTKKTHKPIVAVIGRPNVGKSTFFNKVTGKRISIVKDLPGVTRDRIYADAEWAGHNFTLIDTGGIDLKSNDDITKDIFKQAKAAIDIADVIVLMTDGKEGPVAPDYDVAELLRRCRKPVVVAVNKIDIYDASKAYDFYGLGLTDVYAVSCEHSLGIGDLLDAVVVHFGERVELSTGESRSIAVVGKPNVGKSSLVNRILGFERVIVSNIAGTTRDAIDTPFEYAGRPYTIVDTAGIRRSRSVDDGTVESYGVLRAMGAVRRADVVLIVIDATEEISEQDVRIAGIVHEEGKPCVIVVNKWDAVSDKDTYTIEKYKAKLAEDLAFMSYFRCIFVSAVSGQRVEKIITEVDTAYQNAGRRLTTGTLNDIIGSAIATNEPPSYKGRRLKVLYTTQPETHPPTFALFVNDAGLVHFSYRRYLENCLRKSADFSGTPIKLVFRSRNEEK